MELTHEPSLPTSTQLDHPQGLELVEDRLDATASTDQVSLTYALHREGVDLSRQKHFPHQPEATHSQHVLHL